MNRWLNNNIGLHSMLNQYLQILILLDSDARRDIFIGMTGLLIAIVIFVAEYITKQKYEINQKAYLRTIRLKVEVLVILISLFSMIPISLVKSPAINDNVNVNIYLLLQTALNVAIIVSFAFTAMLLLRMLKISTNQWYAEKSVFSYVKHRVKKLCKKEEKIYQKFNRKRNDFEKYLSDKPCFSNDLILAHNHKEEYEEIKSNGTGHIKGYNTSYINRLYRAAMNKESEYNEELPDLIFIKTIGESIKAGTVIAYYRKKSGDAFKTTNKAVRIDTKYAKYIDEIDNIEKELIAFAREDDSEFDKNNRLLNFYQYICENNLETAKSKLLDNLTDYSRKVMRTQENLLLSRWISQAISVAYEKDHFEGYSNMNNLIEWLYLERRTLKGCSAEKAAYAFANEFFLIPFIKTKGSNDKYYEKLLATLLGIVYGLIKAEEYNAVYIIFDNVFFEKAEYVRDDENVNQLHFQFACGVMLCLFQKCKSAKKLHENKETINNIVKYIFDHFVGIYNACIFISCFRAYYNKPSFIQGRYEWFDSYDEQNEFKNSWTSIGINEEVLIRAMLYAFDISHGYIDGSFSDRINWNDKFFYQRLYDYIHKGFDSEFEKTMKHNFNNDELLKLLNELIGIAKDAEEEYKKNEALEEKKVASFLLTLEECALKETKLIEFLKQIGKSSFNGEKTKEHIGFNKLISRELFFEACYGSDDIAKSFGNAIADGIEARYIDSIKTIAKKSSRYVQNEINRLDDPSNYIIITDYLTLWRLNKKNSDYLKTPKGKVKIVKSRNVEGLLLVKKDCLPKLVYCDFDDDLEDIKGCKRRKFIAYSFVDCSNNDCLRNSIINTSEWLKEKGDSEAQDNYLRQQCNIKLFAAYKIEQSEESSAVLFEETEE